MEKSTLEQLNNLASNKAIEKQPQINPELLTLLNTQIKNELFSAQVYYSIASWLDDRGYNNTSKEFFKYAGEELSHMQKIYTYLYDRNCKVIVPEIPKPISDFKSYRGVFEAGLEHEISVTKNWNDISNKAKALGDNNTYFFSEWFENEQVEEENKMRDILDMMNIGYPDWKIDEMFKG